MVRGDNVETDFHPHRVYPAKGGKGQIYLVYTKEILQMTWTFADDALPRSKLEKLSTYK